MAEIAFNTLQAYGKKTAVIAGSFAPNGTDPVAASSRRGLGFSVVRTAEGVFTITLSKPFNKIICADVTLQLASADDKYCLIGATSPSAGTIVINVWDKSGGAVADVAADDNNRINFFLVLKNSSSTGGYGG